MQNKSEHFLQAVGRFITRNIDKHTPWQPHCEA
jgi:hypothetical protein